MRGVGWSWEAMDEFDISIYYPLPNLTTEGYVSLTKVMLLNLPAWAPPHVTASAHRVSQSLTATEAALVARIEEDLGTRRHRAFDLFVDAVWYVLRERLEAYGIYTHEGAAELTEEDRDLLDWDRRIARARLAGRLHFKVFGDGIEFLRASYSQQSVHMATRLTWLTGRDHGIPLDELVGANLVSLIQVCQVRYEAMVNTRNSRTGKSIADLRQLRDRLRRQLYAYCGVVATMVDPDDDASRAAVEAALRPILVARANSRRKLIGTSLEEIEAKLDAGEDPLDPFEVEDGLADELADPSPVAEPEAQAQAE